MLLEVDGEAALGGETLLTPFMRATERLVLGIPLPTEVRMLMGSHMLGQVPTLTERFATSRHFTLEGTLPRMDPDVLS